MPGKRCEAGCACQTLTRLNPSMNATLATQAGPYSSLPGTAQNPEAVPTWMGICCFAVVAPVQRAALTLEHRGKSDRPVNSTHWTRHPSRLNRDLGRKRFGDEGYAFEELVAELGSAFLCADLQITPEIREDHASYIHEWLKVLKDDKRAVFTAASHASKAVDFLHGLQPQPVA